MKIFLIGFSKLIAIGFLGLLAICQSLATHRLLTETKAGRLIEKIEKL